MKLKLFLMQMLFLMAAANAAAANDVLITQVLYNPLGSESGGEAVELYNPNTAPADISGWIMSTETSPLDVVFPEGTLIRGGGYFLVADAGWSSEKQQSWPQADYEEAMTLANTEAGIALSNGSDLIDAVGWGTAAGIGAGLYEGAPSSGSEEGDAVARKRNGSSYIDTNDNSNDFAAAAPDFHNSSFGKNHGSGEIRIMAIIGGAFPSLHGIKILTDDSSEEGVQVNPAPKSNKTVEVEAVVVHDNGNSHVQEVTLTAAGKTIAMKKAQENNETAATYIAAFNMSYDMSAGNYHATVNATDGNGLSVAGNTSFHYNELIAVEIDANELTFSALPGTAAEISGDADDGTGRNVTISNTGNTVVNFEISSTNLTSSAGMISAESMQYTFNGDYENPLAGKLSNERQRKEVSLQAAAKLPLSIKLDVPTATAPGNYTGTITLVAVK